MAKGVPMKMVSATELSIPEVVKLRDELLELRKALRTQIGLDARSGA
jgi:hypothetical protein